MIEHYFPQGTIYCESNEQEWKYYLFPRIKHYVP